MGRGLSELQKEILKIAYRNRAEKGKSSTSSPVDVSNREVLVEVYSFKAKNKLMNSESTSFFFDRKTLGLKRYQSASVAVAKSFDRLVERGLAKRSYNSGIILTEVGVKVAGCLD